MKKAIALLMLVLLPTIAICQEEMDSYYWYGINHKCFKNAILRERRINKIMAISVAFSKKDSIVRNDTVYIAKFDSVGRVQKEYGYDFLLEYTYTGNTTNVFDILIGEGHIYEAGKIVLNYRLEGGMNISGDSKNNQRDTSYKRYYYYDSQDKLLEQRETWPLLGNEERSMYFYNDRGSRIKKVTIVQEGQEIDSITTSFVYDTLNRLIECHYIPSLTFYRTFPPLDDAGDALGGWHHFYSYDSCIRGCDFDNRKLRHSTLKEYFEGGYVYTVYKYDEVRSREVYTKFIQENLQVETLGKRIRIITYEQDCIGNSEFCLPLFIERIDEDGYTRITFLYFNQ
jgi:hypothetical protein